MMRTLDEIEKKRMDAVESMLNSIHDTFSRLSTGRHCSNTCSSRLPASRHLLSYLGTEGHHANECTSILALDLLRGMVEQGVSSPRPERPFPGLSVLDVFRVGSITQSPEWDMTTVQCHHSPAGYSCGLWGQLRLSMLRILNGIEGLELKNYHLRLSMLRIMDVVEGLELKD